MRVAGLPDPPGRPRVTRVLWLAPALIPLAIWAPVLRHHYLPPQHVEERAIEASRHEPPDRLLRGVERYWLFDDGLDRPEAIVRVAEALLEGRAEFPNEPVRPIRLPFDPDDIDEGPNDWQLSLASLSMPCALLRSYELTGREAFFSAARESILAWDAFERRSWLPRGQIWNDHALSSRVAVLARFWRLYRARPDYRPEVARRILEMAARSGHMLSDPRRFTAATNHGVMQNIALLQLRLAFPHLPESGRYETLAISRLDEQLPFYVSSEGVVLEHSASYQAFGVRLLKVALLYAGQLGRPVPQDWRTKYVRAKRFYATLRRPDGTLPTYGDTVWAAKAGESSGAVTRLRGVPWGRAARYHGAREGLFPVSGYSVWWTGLDDWPEVAAMSQAVVAWSWYPGHAHAHAEEPNVVLWAGGVQWWANVGAWPAGRPGRMEAISWPGSNAPHVVGEPLVSDRRVTVRHHERGPGASIVDLEREGPAALRVRRQVIEHAPDTWVVVDHVSGPPGGRMRTTWTTAPAVRLEPGAVEGSWVLTAPGTSKALTALLFGSPGTSVAHHRGSLAPFAGWAASDDGPLPTSALVLEQPAEGGWSVAVWLWGRPVAAAPSMVRWDGPERWSLSVPVGDGRLRVKRRDRRLLIGEGQERASRLRLADAPDPTAAVARIRAARAQTSARYPSFREHGQSRRRITYAVLALLGLQEATFVLVRRFAPRLGPALRAASVVGWLALVVGLVAVYWR
jgi:hypothetical protein